MAEHSTSSLLLEAGERARVLPSTPNVGFEPVTDSTNIVDGDIVLYEFITPEHKWRWSIGSVSNVAALSAVDGNYDDVDYSNDDEPTWRTAGSNTRNCVVTVKDWTLTRGTPTPIRITEVRSSDGQSMCGSPESSALSQMSARRSVDSAGEVVEFTEGTHITAVVRSSIFRKILRQSPLSSGTQVKLTREELENIRAAAAHRNDPTSARSSVSAFLPLWPANGGPHIVNWAAIMDLLLGQAHAREAIVREELQELYVHHAAHLRSVLRVLTLNTSANLATVRAATDLPRTTADADTSMSGAQAEEEVIAQCSPLQHLQKSEEDARHALIHEEVPEFLALAIDGLEEGHDITHGAHTHRALSDIEQLRYRIRRTQQKHCGVANNLCEALNEVLETPQETQDNLMKLVQAIEGALDDLSQDGCEGRAGMPTPLPLPQRYDMETRFRHITTGRRQAYNWGAAQSLKERSMTESTPGLSPLCGPSLDGKESVPGSVPSDGTTSSTGENNTSLLCMSRDESGGKKQHHHDQQHGIDGSAPQKNILTHPLTFPGEANFEAVPQEQRDASGRIDELERQEREIAHLTILLTRERQQREEAEQHAESLRAQLLSSRSGDSSRKGSNDGASGEAKADSAAKVKVASLYKSAEASQRVLQKRLQHMIATNTTRIEKVSAEIDKYAGEMRVHKTKSDEAMNGSGQSQQDKKGSLVYSEDADVVDMLLQRRIAILQKTRHAAEAEREERMQDVKLLNTLMRATTGIVRAASTSAGN